MTSADLWRVRGDDAVMRVAVVGAGLAGLSAAAALHRDGHEVAVFEQAPSLRATGLALNLWSNATSLLPRLGVPPEEVPGQPFSRMVLRTAGRSVAEIKLPARGLAHVNVERGDLLNVVAATLPHGSIAFGVRQEAVDQLAADHDLVVVADGANSALRNAVVQPPRRRWNWSLWQACVTAEVADIPADAGAGITRAGLFSGVWRLPGGRVTWFVEQPGRSSGTGPALLQELRRDEDPVLRELAAATRTHDWIEWRAEDLWPPRILHRGNVVLVGDAAHPMLPTLGQGACQSLEDAAALAGAIAAEATLDAGLHRYERLRVPRLRRIVALARLAAISRRPSIATRAMPGVVSARLMAKTGGPILRSLTRPRLAMPDESATTSR